MTKRFIYFLLIAFIASTAASCKAKHCPAYGDTMDGYDGGSKKKKRKKNVTLFPKKYNK